MKHELIVFLMLVFFGVRAFKGSERRRRQRMQERAVYVCELCGNMMHKRCVACARRCLATRQHRNVFDCGDAGRTTFDIAAT